MIKLLLEQYRIQYLPVESVSMQERVRAVEFVLGRLGVAEAEQPARQIRQEANVVVRLTKLADRD